MWYIVQLDVILKGENQFSSGTKSDHSKTRSVLDEWCFFTFSRFLVFFWFPANSFSERFHFYTPIWVSVMDFLLFSHRIRICNFYHFRRCLFNFFSLYFSSVRKKIGISITLFVQFFRFLHRSAIHFPNLKCYDHTLPSSPIS